MTKKDMKEMSAKEIAELLCSLSENKLTEVLKALEEEQEGVYIHICKKVHHEVS
ncbi:Mg/Co/Ni transporter MgtE [Metapseudomonas resinovorans]|uniref:hypothetical protein n=1 Tax=Metapseudomonas resinovorans TaxID=53412 RepID=UPI003D1BA350